jgi:beta-N-acetylhexosaminidase
MSPTSLRRQIGQLLIAGFDGHQVPIELRSLAREFGLGGVILFSRNVAEPEQVAELCFDASQLDAEMPLWVSVDQEGGRVARLKAPFTEWPAMATLGRSGDVALAKRFARALASELKAVGINLDYAPVLDIHTNPQNPVIGDRALSEKADEVARLGVAIVEALQSEGVAACGKHFPGHGDTHTDSHLELPLVEHTLDRLRRVELVPFKAAIQADVATIMTAHLLIPPLDEKHPATLSKRIVAELLRGELGYDGIVLSDSLDEMRAITDEYTVPAATVLSIEAGCDGVLICRTGPDAQAAALEALIHAVESDELKRTRVEEALDRHRRVKRRFLTAAATARPPQGRILRQCLGREEHRAIADEMARFL